MKANRITGTFLVAGILVLASLATADSSQQAAKSRWLVFPQCNATSTFNGKTLPLTVFCGKNDDKILYVIPLKDTIVTGNLCIEAAAGFIGVFDNSDVIIQTGKILINPKAVPPATQEATLNVHTEADGYTFIIRADKNVLVCRAPKPLPDPH
jgi:hypothetical protein